MKHLDTLNRRQFLKLTAAIAASMSFSNSAYSALPQISKSIPKTGEMLPVIGLGTSRTFDVYDDPEFMNQLLQVMKVFFEEGGGMIDSSPMYGEAQNTIGMLLQQVKQKNLFSATKVWIEGKEEGIKQMEQSRKKWGIDRFDLMQIHNLVDWETQLETINQMKAEGQLRYTGITTSHGRFHSKLKGLLKNHDFDFLQLTYNIENEEAEPLLNIAQDKGIAVIVNRPYQRGNLFVHVKSKPVPTWAKDFECTTWGQFFLKYIVSHPAITCAIPATTKVKHIKDNMQAGKGRLPTHQQRIKMKRYFQSL